MKSNVGAYCVDFIVPDSDKTNLKSGFQAELSRHLPFLIEKQRKLLPCYVLQPIKGRQVALEKSADTSDVFSYDGLGFEGRGIVMNTFIKYVENELNEPIYDATGLQGNYNLTFSKNNIEPFQSISKSLSALGLELVKGQKEMNVIAIRAK